MFRKTVEPTLADRIAQHDDAAARALDAFTAAAFELEAAAAGQLAVAAEARTEAAKVLNYADYAEESAARNTARAAKIRALTE